MFDLFNTVKFFTRQDMSDGNSASNSFKAQKLCFTFDSKKIHSQFADKLKDTLIKEFVEYEKSRQMQVGLDVKRKSKRLTHGLKNSEMTAE